MAITIDEAREKYNIRELKDKRHIFKLLEKVGPTMMKRKIIPSVLSGVHVPETRFQRHGAYDSKYFDNEEEKLNIWLNDSSGPQQNEDLFAFQMLIPRKKLGEEPRHITEEADEEEVLDDYFGEFSERWQRTMDKILEDKELEKGDREKLCDEIADHMDDILDSAEKSLHNKGLILSGVDHEVVNEFSGMLSKIVGKPFKDKESDEVLEHAKNLFNVSPKEFFLLREAAKRETDKLDRTEMDFEDEQYDSTEEENMANTLDWNVKKIFSSDKVAKFLQEEREKELKKWGLEYFEEGNKVQEEAQKLLKEHKQELIAKGLAEEEIKKQATERRVALEKEGAERLKKMLEPKGKTWCNVEDKLYSMPEKHQKELERLKPPILWNAIPKPKKRKFDGYHV